MFTSRSGSQGNASATPPQSIEAVRRRARHRLIGAAVLVLLGVVGFSLLFDTQPRPLPVDIPILIPAKNAPPPLGASKAPAPVTAERPKAATAQGTASVAPGDSLAPREEVVEPAAPKAAVPAAANTAAKAETTPETRPESQPKAEPPKTVAKPAPSEAERARALLEGKAPDAPSTKAEAASQRIVVQVGAFADAARAREARLKLERAGLKTYTHVAETAEGTRIRVRVGPFATKAEADKAAARVKALGLPAAILTL